MTSVSCDVKFPCKAGFLAEVLSGRDSCTRSIRTDSSMTSRVTRPISRRKTETTTSGLAANAAADDIGDIQQPETGKASANSLPLLFLLLLLLLLLLLFLLLLLLLFLQKFVRNISSCAKHFDHIGSTNGECTKTDWNCCLKQTSNGIWYFIIIKNNKTRKPYWSHQWES